MVPSALPTHSSFACVSSNAFAAMASNKIHLSFKMKVE